MSRGFSFIEIMVSALIILMILNGIFFFNRTLIEQSRAGSSNSDDLSNFHFLIRYLRHDIRQCNLFRREKMNDSVKFFFRVVTGYTMPPDASLEYSEVQYVLNKDSVVRREKPMGSTSYKERVFTFNARFGLDLARSENRKDMLNLTHLQLQDSKGKSLFDWVEGDQLKWSEKIGIRSFLPVIH